TYGAVLVDGDEALAVVGHPAELFATQSGQRHHAIGLDALAGVELDAAVLERRRGDARPQADAAIAAEVADVLGRGEAEGGERLALGGDDRQLHLGGPRLADVRRGE